MFDQFDPGERVRERSRSMSIRITPAEDDAIDDECKRLGMNRANFIRMVLGKYFTQLEEAPRQTPNISIYP